MKVLFCDNQREWLEEIRMVPRAGDYIRLNAAPEDLAHRVTRVVHWVGGGDHRIIIRLMPLRAGDLEER